MPEHRIKPLSRAPGIFDVLLADPGVKILKRVIPESLKTVRLVGGCVRDTLLGFKPGDIDVSTTYLPKEILSHLRAAKIPTRTLGMAFGTVTALIRGQAYEITSCRQDIKTDGRWAHVTYTQDWQLDAQRRDFTFNALYLTLDGNLYDYTNGVNDLNQGIVRFIGDPAARLTEDRLRLLRYYRFWGRFGRCTPDSDLIPVFKQTALELEILSGERLKAELLEMLALPQDKWQRILKGFNAINLLENLFKSPPHQDNLTMLPLSPLGRLWTLYRPDIARLRTRLALSNHETTFLKRLQQAYESCPPWPLEIHDIYGKKIFEDWCILRGLPSSSLPDPLPLFPVVSGDLQNVGYEGQDLGRALKSLRSWWLSNNGQPSKNQCLEWLQAQAKEKT